jgi:drug/metabolite transporter (DMT)-like permease
MKNALLKMHLAVFLWGFTGVLGRAIDLSEFPLVWYRTMLTALIFLLILHVRKQLLPLPPRRALWRFAGIGTIIAIHWVAFYGSIKYANASIALTCLSTAGIFTALLEPLIRKVPFRPAELLVGSIALAGMYFIYRFETGYALGIGLGLIASLLSSVFTVLNKEAVVNTPARQVAFLEIGAGFLALTVLLPFYRSAFPEVSFTPTPADWGWLFVLSLCCTVWAQSLALSALKQISSFTAVLMVNLEPVYGIILAIVLFQENRDLGWGFVTGMLLIALSVGWHTVGMMRKGR